MLPFQLVSFSFSNSVTGLFYFPDRFFLLKPVPIFGQLLLTLLVCCNLCGHNWINGTIFIYALIRLVQKSVQCATDSGTGRTDDA